MSVRFRFGWVDSGPSPDKLAQSTMAVLRVDTDSGTVTATVDRRNGIYSSEIVVPLYNVAEWLVTNWWHLWYEVPDTNEQPPDFESRHNLAFVGDGFVLPQLNITSSSSRRAQLAWTRHKPPHARIEFLDEGSQTVEREELEAEFRNLIDAVLERVCADPQARVAAHHLRRAWNAVNDLEDDEVEFSRAAARFGVDRQVLVRRRPQADPHSSSLGGNLPRMREGTTPSGGCAVADASSGRPGVAPAGRNRLQ